ncbi:MAG: recombinase RecT [Oscillospiraceae bacterium]|jgi:recombination protein RecT|nr:recombinase RecT [Oscillospiraceae bacterium]
MATNQLSVFKSVVSAPDIQRKIKASMGDASGAFIASLLDLYESDTTLQKCDPQKVALECVKAAALKLPLVKSLGFAYVVPYKNVPTFTIGYKGLIQLAQRSGQYRCINADVVYEGELLGFNKLSGMPDLTGERTGDNVVGYFSYFQLLNGFEKTIYMTREDMDAWGKRYSPSYTSSYSPWKTEFDKMALKTCLRRLISTYGVMSTEMQTALMADVNVQQSVNNEVQANAATIPVDTNTGEVLDAEAVQYEEELE